ncbi:25.3 kDa vesicle transport protein SEC22-1-like [Bidens hawaiensis]|uniref:25.3 kDa vesicle transport protein SEC22-1-like n=1 Tax=Bidens hawaiensis TaxID=980011 RepID=UPI00404B6D64
MVKLTIIGRMHDELPIYKDDDNNIIYKKHAEFLLHEISMDALPPSAATIFLHNQCFNYMVRNGVCFITLCDVSYPRKLAFYYLQDLQKEFDKVDPELVNQITKPYTFVKFDNTICNIRRQYVDARTQVNLSKLNADHKLELEVLTEDMSTIVERRKRSDMMERMMKAHKSTSPVWDSKTLEVIATKWTPIAIIFFVAFVLLWSSLKAYEKVKFSYMVEP